MNDELKATLLGLLLPCDPAQEQALLDWFQTRLQSTAASDYERSTWLRTQVHQWVFNGTPEPAFKKLVQQALYLENRNPVTFMFSDCANKTRSTAAKNLASHYFTIHQRLMDQYLMSFDQAREFISYSSYIVDLSSDHRMSASEISRVLGSRDERYKLQWRATRFLLERCRVAGTVSAAQFQAVFTEEAEAEPELLSDLSLDEAVEYVGRVGRSLGLQHDLASNLRILLLEGSHEPYICILHYQLMSLHFCDHAVTYAYEFSPRGQNAAFLMKRYNESGVSVAKNAFLNNAKALLRFDAAWVDGRAENRRPAAALAAVLGFLESMAPLAKRELSRFVLAVLQRNLRISAERSAGRLPDELVDFDAEAASHLLRKIGAEGSGTKGIIEQRIVDCFGIHQHNLGWISRGLGDSVFAASTFSRKLGDAEFINTKTQPPKVVGYESHGGHLSALYIEDHFDTFFQVLDSRALEFENTDSLLRWSFEVVFVAHSFADRLPAKVSGETQKGTVDVAVRYLSFTDACNTLAGVQNRQALLNEFLVKPLNQYHVHRRIRQYAIELAA